MNLAPPSSPPSGASDELLPSDEIHRSPRSPSKIGAGPVSPSAASRAANTPLRAALAKRATFPHAQFAGSRLPQGHVAHAGNADGVRAFSSASSSISLPAATADEIAP